MRRPKITTAATLLVAAFAAVTVRAEQTPAIKWMQQFGTTEVDRSRGVAVDRAGNVYVAGYTKGSLGGTNAGNYDAFLGKFDAFGNRLWIDQFGSGGEEISRAVSLDRAGNAFICGQTQGSLGGPNAGRHDMFVRKYDSTGNAMQTHQLGSDQADDAYGVAVDPTGNIHVGGHTGGSLDSPNSGKADAIIVKYDDVGNPLWMHQLGTNTFDGIFGVDVDEEGNVYFGGQTEASLLGPTFGHRDAFLGKYDPAGEPLWSRQFGTPEYERGYDVAVDRFGNVYITGNTTGSLGGPYVGNLDVYLRKYDPAGNALWTQQLGSDQMDESHAVAVDAAGNAYIAGYTKGNLGDYNAGSWDAFVCKYDAEGNQIWIDQQGTPTDDYAYDIAVDDWGTAYIVGYTNGDLAGYSAGLNDVFVIAYVPEPGTLAMLACAAGALLLVYRRRR